MMQYNYERPHDSLLDLSPHEFAVHVENPQRKKPTKRFTTFWGHDDDSE